MKGWLNYKVVLGGIIFAVVAFAMLLSILWFAKADDVRMAPPTAIISVIEIPTATIPAPMPTQIPTQASTSEQQERLPGSNLKIGDLVQVTGTGGDGLRLHVTAGIAGKVDYIALDSEVFIVKNGPVDADGYIWWELQDPYTDNVVGWGVTNFLAPVQNP